MGERFDLLIRGGDIVDGSGSDPFNADVGIKDGRIAALGEFYPGDASRVIDAGGLVVSPGFIDIHGHSDISILVDGRAYSLAAQGITTQVIGNCGFSAAPLGGDYAGEYLDDVKKEYGLESCWSSLSEYIKLVEDSGISINIVPLTGHSNIRGAVMGYNAASPSDEQIASMGEILKESLEEGSWGLSTGLIYPPGCFGKEDEIADLACYLRGLAPYYASHIRSESDELPEAVREGLAIGERAGVRVEISHLKAAYPRNWGKVNKALSLMEEAEAKGMNVGCDVYPYAASSTTLAAVLPEWFSEGGQESFLFRLGDPGARDRAKKEIKRRDWSKVMISSVMLRGNKFCEGMKVTEYAASVKKEPEDSVLDLLLEEKGFVSAIYFSMCEEDVETVIRHPLSVIGSDSEARRPEGVLSKGKPHPRCYGTFPRVIRKYVREKSLLTLPEAVRKMASISALRMGIADRGIVGENYRADLVIFSPEDIRDTADFINPHQLPVGIKAVIVNGVTVFYENEHTGAMPGIVLKRSSRCPKMSLPWRKRRLKQKFPQ